MLKSPPTRRSAADRTVAVPPAAPAFSVSCPDAGLVVTDAGPPSDASVRAENVLPALLSVAEAPPLRVRDPAAMGCVCVIAPLVVSRSRLPAPVPMLIPGVPPTVPMTSGAVWE